MVDHSRQFGINGPGGLACGLGRPEKGKGWRMASLARERDGKLTRRRFLVSSAAGAGLVVSAGGRIRARAPKTGDLNVALIGHGVQGKRLLENCMKMQGLVFRAVCDIWDYQRKYGTCTLKKHKHPTTGYADYRDMLAGEKDLDAAIVATPDWMHAEQTIACLKAGIHVYCEKEMSNDLAKARQMVLAARETGKLLQIGHQRRSDPRYIYSLNTLVRREKLLGRITHACGQWNRDVRKDIGWPRRIEIDAGTLGRYGYASMHEFRNWRWYRKYGGGPMADLGSHQIDVFNWFLGVHPAGVLADGGVDFYENHEWYDNVMAIYEYPTPAGPVRAFYQVLTTTGMGGYYEQFMGTRGTIYLSEGEPRTYAYRERHQVEREVWEDKARRGCLREIHWPDEDTLSEAQKDLLGLIHLGPSSPLEGWRIPVEARQKFHRPHLENFFDAIRGKVKLNCPAEVGYATAVAVLKTSEAVAAERKIRFKPEEFRI